MDSALSLRTATPADLDAISDLLALLFHDRPSAEQRTAEQSITEPGRSIVAEQDGQIIGHATVLTRDLTVPGAIIPAAHVTGVGVAPTHRRRGLLNRMMRQQLEELAAAGRESIAVLWASESSIYQRYGYGPASSRLSLEIMSREVGIGPAAGGPELPATANGRLRMIDPAKSADELAAVFERARPGQVGVSSRGPKWWEYLLTDHSEPASNRTGRRGVLYEDESGPAGYALWQTDARWGQWGAESKVGVSEMVADGPAAYAMIWRFLLGIDLARTVEYSHAATDEELQYLVGDPRRLGRRTMDGLWIRLVDLPAALEARQYVAPLDVVIEVTDPILERNSGRWRLAGEPGKVTCARTTDAPDFACSVTDLGAAYLGGTTLSALAAAGRVRPLTGNLPSVAFGWHRQPHPIEVF